MNKLYSCGYYRADSCIFGKEFYPGLKMVKYFLKGHDGGCVSCVDELDSPINEADVRHLLQFDQESKNCGEKKLSLPIFKICQKDKKIVRGFALRHA